MAATYKVGQEFVCLTPVKTSPHISPGNIVRIKSILFSNEHHYLLFNLTQLASGGYVSESELDTHFTENTTQLSGGPYKTNRFDLDPPEVNEPCLSCTCGAQAVSSPFHSEWCDKK